MYGIGVSGRGRQGSSRGPWFAARLGIMTVATIVLLNAGAVYFLTRASTEMLVTTSRVLVIMGLVGLVVMTFVVAVRASLSGHDAGGGPGARPRPITVFSRDDPDAELRRILDDARLGDIAAARRARMHGRGPGAA